VHVRYLRGPERSNAPGLPGELVGDFNNTGRAWVLEPTAVNVHDFPSAALGRAVPYGVYDLTLNRGQIYLGNSGDTPAFTADAIEDLGAQRNRTSVLDMPVRKRRPGCPMSTGPLAHPRFCSPLTQLDLTRSGATS